MKDLKIVDISYNSEYYPGCCDTCDYGSSYVNEFTFTYEDDTQDTFEVEGSNNVVSESTLMRLILNNNTKNSLTGAIINHLTEYNSIYYNKCTLKINNKEIEL